VTKTSNLETPIDYQQLVEVIGDAIVVADASGAINLWNPAAERLFGFTQAEALGNSLDLIIPERLRSASLGWLQKNHGERGDTLRS
jgi:PAS domain S-box-containing protein